MKKPRRRQGLPKALQAVEDQLPQQSPEEFAKEFFGTADKPVEGMPSMEWLKEHYKTKSAVIRYLVYKGHSIKDISRHTGIRYQMVRNVATNQLKRGPNEDWRPAEMHKPIDPPLAIPHSTEVEKE